MQVTKLKEESTNFEAKVVIPHEIINNEVQKTLNDLKNKIKMPGFRPGKVPFESVKKKHAGSVRLDVVNNRINESIKEIVKENKFNVSSSKLEDLKDNEGDNIEFILKLEIIPEITLPAFDKISLEKPVVKIPKKELQAEIDKLAKQHTIYEKEKEGQTALGDRVTLDAVGSIDGVEFEGGKVTGHKLVLGSKSFIDNFEDQLVGFQAGDETVVKVTFPANYHMKDVASKAAEFQVKILAVHEGEAPKIDEEFVQKFGCKTVEELEDKISGYISGKFHNEINTIMKMHLFNQLENMLTFDVPPSLLDKEYNILKTQTKEVITQDENFKNKTPEEIDEYCKKLASRRVRIGLLLIKYAGDKNLKITADELNNAVKAEARTMPGYEKKIFEFYNKNPNAVEQLRNMLLEQKAVEEIFAHEVKITTKDYTQKQLEELIKKETESGEVF